MVKDDSLYIIAIVAVVAVVGLVIMATGSSSTVMVAEDLPSMVEDSDSTAIAGEAFRTVSSSKLYDRGYGGVSGSLDYGGRKSSDISSGSTNLKLARGSYHSNSIIDILDKYAAAYGAAPSECANYCSACEKGGGECSYDKSACYCLQAESIHDQPLTDATSDCICNEVDGVEYCTPNGCTPGS